MGKQVHTSPKCEPPKRTPARRTSHVHGALSRLQDTPVGEAQQVLSCIPPCTAGGCWSRSIRKLYRTRQALEEREGGTLALPKSPTPRRWRSKFWGLSEAGGFLWSLLFQSSKQLQKVDQTQQNILSWKVLPQPGAPWGPRAASLPLWSSPGCTQSPAGLTHWTGLQSWPNSLAQGLAGGR